MSKDPCRIIETVPDEIWNENFPRRPVPAWIYDLVNTISSSAGVNPPTVRVMQVRCPTTFGGRWFYNACNSKKCIRNAIGIILHEDRSLTRTVVIHEMGHYLSSVMHRDRRGQHDDRFYAILEPMYRQLRVRLETAKVVEGSYPKHWENATSWNQIKR